MPEKVYRKRIIFYNVILKTLNYFTKYFTGTVTVVAPLYIAEISPTPLRGAMGTCHQLMVTIGILLGQVRKTRDTIETVHSDNE